MKLGSLFDGSGGFPLAGSLCGIEPVWAAEIEPYPIAVTRSRFPSMKHLGDISKVNGAEIEPVDIVTFGSPCQDLSVAGKRAGLRHESNGDEETTRSGLFMEAVRIIREMREVTNGVYPRFALWENVPGAFSSNKGEDFRVVLEELIKIVEPAAVMPTVPKNGWSYADHYCGDGWSLAYRTFDAQYWGVPQRRRRIYLVLDLGGQCAGEVSFERDGLRGYFTEGRTPWQGIAPDAERSSGATDCEGEGNCLTPWDVQSRRIFTPNGAWPALYGGEGGGHGYVCYQNNVPYLLKIRSGCEGGGKGALIQTDMSATLSTLNDQYLFQPVVSAGFCPEQSAKTRGIGYEEEESPTLRAGVTPAVVVKEQHLFENHSQDTRYKGPLDVCPMLPAQLGTGGNNTPFVVEETPVVCCIDGDKIGKAERAGGSGLGIRDGDTMYTLTAKDAGTHAVCIPINDKATRYKGGGPTRNADGSGNGLGVGSNGDPAPTLSTCDRHIVCYGIGNGQANQSYSEEVVGALNCIHDQQAVAMPIVFDKEVYQSGQNANGGHYISEGGPAPTLRTTGSPPGVAVQYIVRRLTPTECARLQGFADGWGIPDPKGSFTPEEYRFWLEIRNTHAAINGKVVKDYTEKQMLKWYNKLHTDSSEYKMWGNGIALPTALYVMQGIADVLN